MRRFLCHWIKLPFSACWVCRAQHRGSSALIPCLIHLHCAHQQPINWAHGVLVERMGWMGVTHLNKHSNGKSVVSMCASASTTVLRVRCPRASKTRRYLCCAHIQAHIGRPRDCGFLTLSNASYPFIFCPICTFLFGHWHRSFISCTSPALPTGGWQPSSDDSTSPLGPAFLYLGVDQLATPLSPGSSQFTDEMWFAQ